MYVVGEGRFWREELENIISVGAVTLNRNDIITVIFVYLQSIFHSTLL